MSIKDHRGKDPRNRFGLERLREKRSDIQRRYEPEAEALDRVVEILYQLLMDEPDVGTETVESGRVVAQESTCLSTEPE
jgi:hypothetical protein